MSTTLESTILLLGLTGTGKTNFLVALDVILDEQTDSNGLVHSDFAADRAYLQPLREQWLRGKELDHTSRQIPPPPHQLLVLHPASGTRAVFHVPDLAGETYGAQFVTRSFPSEFGKRIEQAAGLILFLHCDDEPDNTLLEQPSLMDANPASGTELVVSAQSHAPEWRLEDASRQVKLVDLLQFIADIRSHRTPLRVAVAISAWDRVENAPQALETEMPKDPVRFLSRRWPLLVQFLQSNSELFPFRIFGVSARGGGNTPDEIARLTKLASPRDRVLLVDGTHRSNDLTRPVRWLLGLLDPAPISNV